MSQNDRLEPEDSPCQLVCSMDKETGFCFGCARTTHEIAYWTTFTAQQKEDIRIELAKRLPPLTKKLQERRKLRRVNRRRNSLNSE